MKKNGGSILFGILGILFLVVTVCIYLLMGFLRTELSAWSLTFVLFSEVLLFGGLTILSRSSIRPSNIFIRSGVAVILTMYFFATAFCSLLSGLFVQVSAYLLVQIILLAVTAVLITLIVFFSGIINNTNQTVVSNRQWMDYYEDKIYKLLTEVRNTEYKDGLTALYESIRYSDKTVFSSVDGSIAADIGILEQLLQSPERADESIRKTMDALSALLSQRKMEASHLKRGGL